VSDESQLPAQARLRGAKVIGIRAVVEFSDAVGRSGPKQKVDAQYAVVLTTTDGRQEIWDTMTAHGLDVDLRDGAIEEQFDFVARSAAQDVENEMEQVGYRGRAARDLPIEWCIGPLLEAHPDRVRIDP
jgi:hypothetical protein